MSVSFCFQYSRLLCCLYRLYQYQNLQSLFYLSNINWGGYELTRIAATISQVQLKIHKSQAGLGTNASLSVEEALTLKTKNQKNWEKARERFADTCQTTGTPKKKEKPKVKSWVRSEAEQESQVLRWTSVDYLSKLLLSFF